MNCYKEQYVNVISLKKYCLMVLHKWRAVMIAVCIGAVLLSGFAILNGMRTMEVPRLSAEELANAQVTIETNLTNRGNCENMIAKAQRQIVALEGCVERYESLYSYTLELQGEQTDPEVIVRLLEILEKLEEYIRQLNETKENVAVWQSQIETIDEQNASLQAQMNETVIVHGKGNVKLYALIGAALGVCVVCVWVFAKWFFARKLTDSESLVLQFGLLLLGDFHETETGRKKQCAVDRLISKLENAGRDYTDSYVLSAAKIQLLAGDSKRIMITGTVDEETLTNVRDALAACMDGGYEVFAACNPVKNAQSVTQISESKIVLVEKVGVSNQREICSLVEFLSISNAAVLGTLSL